MMHLLRALRSRWPLTCLLVGLVAALAVGGYFGSRFLIANYHWREAAAQLERFDFDAAGEHLAYCQARWPDDPAVLFLVGQTARRSGISELAEESFDQCLRASAEFTEAVRQERMLLDLQQGQVTQDRETYFLQKLTSKPPDQLYILEALSFGYARTYHLQKSLEAMGMLLADHPNHIPIRLRRAWVQERLEHPDDAAQEYREILAIDPKQPTARLRLGTVLLLTSHLDEAKERFAQLHAEQPDNPTITVNLAATLAKLGESEQALGLLEPIMQTSPQDVGVLMELGKVLRDAGQQQQAADLFLRAVSIDPHDYPSRYQLVLSLRQLGSKDLAEHEAKLKEVGADLEALSELTFALQTRSYDPDLRSKIGQIFLRRGEDREGLIWLQSVLSVSPGHAETRAVLSNYYLQRGLIAEAARYRN